MEQRDGRDFRVGLYVQVGTRDRLKLYQAKAQIRLGRTLSQSDTIDLLLDAVGEPSLAEMVGDGNGKVRVTLR